MPTKRQVDAAVDRTIDACGRIHEGAFEWQDCAEGVNLVRRLLRKGASPVGASKAATRLCAIRNKYPGPRARCQAAVRRFSRELRRGR